MGKQFLHVGFSVTKKPGTHDKFLNYGTWPYHRPSNICTATVCHGWKMAVTCKENFEVLGSHPCNSFQINQGTSSDQKWGGGLCSQSRQKLWDPRFASQHQALNPWDDQLTWLQFQLFFNQIKIRVFLSQNLTFDGKIKVGLSPFYFDINSDNGLEVSNKNFNRGRNNNNNNNGNDDGDDGNNDGSDDALLLSRNEKRL